MSDRKKDHIELAFQSQTNRNGLDIRFDYEPLLSAHPNGELPPINFLGKTFRVPMWISSMTGGTQEAFKINRNLAMVCKEFGFGMGLGSCRMILDNNDHFEDFNVRDYIGDDLPLFANLGIAQVEQLIENSQTGKILQLTQRLRADGLIIHVNPMQEWFQPEGDHIKHPPIETIKKLIDKINLPLIVKEVGQGMGPSSLRSLLNLPVAAIEFAAYGGTNFSKLEINRDSSQKNETFEPLTRVGMDAYQMLEAVNTIIKSEKPVGCNQLIISGGITSFLDGYYLTKKSLIPAVYGQASTMLKFAREEYSQLQTYVSKQVKGLEMANAYLRVR